MLFTLNWIFQAQNAVAYLTEKLFGPGTCPLYRSTHFFSTLWCILKRNKRTLRAFWLSQSGTWPFLEFYRNNILISLNWFKKIVGLLPISSPLTALNFSFITEKSHLTQFSNNSINRIQDLTVLIPTFLCNHQKERKNLSAKSRSSCSISEQFLISCKFLSRKIK